MRTEDELNLMERTFQIARSGDCRTLDALKRQLRAEGYTNIDAHFAGTGLRKQLRGIMGQS